MGLDRVFSVSDMRKLAKAKLPRMVFDYIDGGAEDEVTLRRSVSRFDEYEWTWDALKDVADIDLTTRVMGHPCRLPFFITPTAASRLFHPKEGELAVARAASKADLIYSCSTMASQTVEDIANAAEGPKWVQVYVWKDRKLVEDFLHRAKAAGFTGCILTVDVPVAGKRERDPRNYFSVPPKMSLPLALQVAMRPAWLRDFLQSPPMTAANFKSFGEDTDIMAFIDNQFSRSVTWDDAAWMKEVWGGAFAIKGISRAADAERCVDAGADAVWVSNHGGRQLDTVVPTIDLLPEIVDAVAGRADVIFDGGVRRGGHIAKALALGATGVAIGRAWLYGLGAAGEAGVAKSIAILEDELRRTFALLGVTRVSELKSDYLRRPAGPSERPAFPAPLAASA